MIRAAHLFGLGILAIFAGLLMIAAPEHAFAQVARTISNVASLEWGAPSARQRIASNRVDTPIAPAGGITSAPFMLPADQLSQAMLESSCAAIASSRPTTRSNLSALAYAPITQLVAGQSIVLAVDRPAANRDASVAETINLYVRTDNGDRGISCVRRDWRQQRPLRRHRSHKPRERL